MAFGILEPKDTVANVPGTTLLDVHEQAEVDNSPFLKKGTGRNSHVVLIPQPSEDPNDPLNWPLWQRDLLLLLLTSCTLVTIGGFGPILAPVAVTLIVEFEIDFTKFSLLSGYNLCATGAVGIFIAAVCSKYGKRPALLFSMTCAFVGSVWAATATSYGSFLGARVVQGLSMSFFESVMFSMVGDLYFVHERGTRMALYICMLSGIANLPTLIAGKVDESMGWRWIFWLLAIFSGMCYVLVIFFGWETAYNREAIYDVDNSSQENLQMIDELKSKRSEVNDVNHVETMDSTTLGRRHSLLHRLLPFSGPFNDTPIWKSIISPFLIFFHPAVMWATLTISFPVLWLVGISLVIAQIFSAPPYLLSPAQIGYMSAGPVVSGVLANLLCALLSDWSAKWLSRRNGGRYEPEFRLFLILGLFFCSALGYFLFGYLVSQGASVVAISVVYAITAAGCQFSSVCVGAYMVDAYRVMSVDVFIVGMVFKNFLFFGFSYFLNDWVATQGPRNFFYTVGGIQVGLCLLTIPLYIYGKTLRVWWHVRSVAPNQ